MPVAEQAEVQPVRNEDEKPAEKKPKKEKVEKKGKDKNAGKQGRKWLEKLQFKCLLLPLLLLLLIIIIPYCPTSLWSVVLSVVLGTNYFLKV